MDMNTACTLEVLGRAECLRLLGSVPVGRIIYTRNALPAVELVNFVVHGGVIMFRTSASGKLAAAIREAVVAFEADSLDAEHRTGWSVTAVGRAQMVTGAAELTRLAETGLRTWVPGPHDYYVRITPELITGRRLFQDSLRRPAHVPGPSSWRGGPVGTVGDCRAEVRWTRGIKSKR